MKELIAAPASTATRARPKLGPLSFIGEKLIEAIRYDHDVVGHTLRVDYGEWTREQADSITRDRRQ